ncbi:hypothetical protein E4U41_004205 [Claviceps citrina]|nr:hypothetical protein E4U41_004205 [Claviceps citrina]
MGLRRLTVALYLACSAVARTNLQGCTYYDSVVKPSQQAAYAARLWYVPGSGEVCQLLDCGGGRAPPKKTVPGCPLYKGTETYSPSFVDPKTLGQTAAAALTGTGTSPLSDGTATTAVPAPTSAASTIVVTSAAETSTSTWVSLGVVASSSKPTSTSTGAAQSFATGAALAPCLVAGVAAGLGLF